MSTKKELSKKYKSSTHYILRALIPYTESNLKLSFMPKKFFNDLEKLDEIKAKQQSLRNSYHRAIKKGYIIIGDDDIPRLTHKGQSKLGRYKPKKLGKNSRLLLIFDIPEEERQKRDRLRLLLRELYFKQIQKSVWETEYDCIKYLKAEMYDQGLQEYVIVYESNRLKV